MILVLSVIMGIGFGIGFALLVFGHFLDNSNNIGDSVGSGFYYVRSRKFTDREDKMNSGESFNFMARNRRLLD